MDVPGTIPSPSAQKPNAVVAACNLVSPWLLILRIVPDRWDIPSFEPGQFVMLGLPGSAPRCALAEPEGPAPPADRVIRRAYSICSASSNQAFMEFYIHLVPEGALSPRLFGLKMGLTT